MAIIPSIKLFIDSSKQRLGNWLPLKAQQFGDIINPQDQPLREYITTPPKISEGFERLRKAEEEIGQYEVPFLPKTSTFRYLPGQLAKTTGEFTLPQTPIEAGLFAIPLGTLGRLAKKTRAGKAVSKVVEAEVGKVAPKVFRGFKDLTTKVLEKLKGKSMVSRQFISDLTNIPELKQAERNVIRDVLDSYGVKAEKGIIPQELQKRAVRGIEEVKPEISILDIPNIKITKTKVAGIPQFKITHEPTRRFFTLGAKDEADFIRKIKTQGVKEIVGEIPPIAKGITPEIKQAAINRVNRAASEIGAEVKEIWIVGSRAKGTSRPNSDVDLVVKFKGKVNDDKFDETLSKRSGFFETQYHGQNVYDILLGEKLGPGVKIFDTQAVKGVKGIIPQELQPLAQEARKFKSAEEFVNKGIQNNKLGSFWMHETEGIKITSMGNDTRQRWWKEKPERKFEITPEIAQKYNESFGKYGGHVIPGQEAYSYKNELLIKPATNSQLTDFYAQAIKGVEEVSDRIPVAEFAEKVRSKLLLLKADKFGVGSPRYESIALSDELRGNVANYYERIWRSPIKTSAGQVHFDRMGGENYFGHTRIEDMAPSITQAKPHAKISRIKTLLDRYEGTGDREALDDLAFQVGFKKSANEKEVLRVVQEQLSRLEKEKISSAQTGVRRITELQTDLYQKGALERETKGYLMYGEKSPREIELSKLQQYNNPTAHFRMVREEVKQAAIDGKTKLQFPTGETAMKIEGLGEFDPRGWRIPGKGPQGTALMLDSPEQVKKIKIGMELTRSDATDWIITDILGEGKFKAVPKQWESQYKAALKSPETKSVEHYKETFDISGKIDTSNPIYRFYEKDLGRYLQNKFGAKYIKDNKGVSWWEIDIKPEMGKAPVEAFGAIPLVGALQGQEEGYNQNKEVPFVPNQQLFINR